MRRHPAIAWRTGQIRLLREFGGHSQPVQDVAFTPDKNRLVSVDGTEAKTWDITAASHGALVRTVPLPGACGLTPDGTLALDRNGELRRTDGGSVAARVGKHASHAFSHDGTLLAHAARNKPFTVTMERGGKLSVAQANKGLLNDPEQEQLILGLVQFTYHSSRDYLSETSPKTEGGIGSWANVPNGYGRQMVGMNLISSLSVTDMTTGQELRMVALKHAHLFVDIAVSGSARLVAARIPTGEVILTDIDSGKRVHSFNSPPAQSLLNTLVFSPAGDRILVLDVSAPGDKPGNEQNEHTQMSMWDITTGSLASSSTIGARCGAVTFSPDGRLIAALGTYGAVSLFDADTLKALSTIGTHFPTAPPCLAFSPDGSLLATGGDRGVKIWGP